MDARELHRRRLAAVQAWQSFVAGQADQLSVRPEILRSWQRSGAAISPDVSYAPMDDEGDTATYFRESPLQIAVQRVEEELRRSAEDGDLVLAVTDAQTRILWTYGGRLMRRKAESVNFVPGARWDEASVGTNALAISVHDRAPSMVFSAEHYAPIVHNWVCWAAPLTNPVTGEHLGVIDLSTTWDRSHPIGLATARMMARMIETAMPISSLSYGLPAPTRAGLQLHLLGSAQAMLDGERILLNRRQTEILALLVLHPEGLSLEQLHALVYGDSAVTLSTLKAEVSHLRSALHGQLSSRPYRLTMPTATDVEAVLELVRRGHTREAVAAYGGDLLPGTNSPALSEYGEYVAVAVREAVLANPEPEAVLAYSERAPYDTEVLEVCLARLAGSGHRAIPLLKGKLAAASR